MLYSISKNAKKGLIWTKTAFFKYVRTYFYGTKIQKNIYKNAITKSATQGLPFHHFLRFKPIKKQKRINYIAYPFCNYF